MLLGPSRSAGYDRACPWRLFFLYSAIVTTLVALLVRCAFATEMMVIEQENNGPWKVGCGRDQISDELLCFVFGVSRLVQGELGGYTSLTISISITKSRPKPLFVFRIGSKNLNTGVVVRVDDQQPLHFKCARVSDNLCYLGEDDGAKLIDTMSTGTELVARVNLAGRPHDFTFDNLGEFQQSMQDLHSFAKKHF
ncbi:MAG: hypothetical protein ACREVF_03760 [Burkholderiales bacterium]